MVDSAGPEEIARVGGFDPSRPNAARIYDYLLDGKDNFAADRQAAAELLRALPDAAQVAKANRAFLAAAVRYIATHGIMQYADIGAGLPTSPNVHQSARTAVPGARVAYIDNDAVVVSHARALLATDDLVRVIREDARDYQAVLSALERDRLIDLAEPVCVLFVSMLHFMTAAEADALVAAFRERIAPGSYLVISAGVTTERNIPAGEQIQAAYGDRTTLTGRPAAEIAAYFGDFELVPPGLVPVTDWRLEGTSMSQRPVLRRVAAPTKAGMLAGIGYKAR